MDLIKRIKLLSKKHSREIINLRRKIHKYPELSFSEFETAKLIYSKLKAVKPNKITKIAGTGVTALINGKSDTKCVGLRADMDALPILEKTGLRFSSRNPGVMHALRCHADNIGAAE
jgi:metal-dependent amidase/aminoacylase/carboxypeptidase family protein